MEKNEKRYARLIRKIRPVLVYRYGEDKTAKLLRGMEPIYDRFLVETPSIGGKKNPMSVNTDMALPFFALYEASERSISAEVINEMLDVVMVSQYRKMGRKINAHKGKDWNNTWGIQVNPEGHNHGFAMTLVGCPIADFAKTHGYMNIMPLLCAGDIKMAEALHAKLIRHHTVAQGADSCDYWYIGDQET